MGTVMAPGVRQHPVFGSPDEFVSPALLLSPTLYINTVSLEPGVLLTAPETRVSDTQQVCFGNFAPESKMGSRKIFSL